MALETTPAWLVGPAKVLAVIAAAYLVGKLAVKPLTGRLLKRSHPPLARPLSRVSLYITVVAGVFAGLSAGGYSGTLGAAGSIVAAGTLAIGFAMKDTLAAFVAGIFIFVDKPFQIGDWIEWDGNEGKVQDITLRTTKIETFDNELLTVPNDRIANTTVRNMTANDRLRLTTEFGIGYGDDIDEAKRIVREVIDGLDGVADDPGPRVALRELGESTVDLRAFYWVHDPRRAGMIGIKESLLRQVKERFEEAGIDMPYPTRTIAGDAIDLRGLR